jgi:hypothetical protein
LLIKPLIAAALLTLAGCAGGPTAEEIAAADHAACTKYGFQASTQPYANCRMALDMQHAQQDAAYRAFVAQGLQPWKQATAAGMYSRQNQGMTCQNMGGGQVRCW